MARGNDEAFTLYGLLAKSVETDDTRSYVTFRLDPRARFSDGKPVTADDVLFSWALLRDKGRPNHRQYYAKVAKAEAHRTRSPCASILAGANDRELPLILGLMPVLPRHAVDPATLRGDHDDRADRFRPLSRQRGEARRQRDADAQPRLLGPRSAGQPRPVEFRRDQARLLSRGQRPVRGVQARPLRFPRRARAAALARRLRFPGRAQRRGDPRHHQDRHAAAVGISGLQHPPSGVCRYPRAPGADAAVRLRMDQPELLLRALRPHRRLLCRLRTVGLRPRSRRARARTAEAVSRRVSRPIFSTAATAFPSPTARAATAPRCAARSRCCPKPATISTARCCASARPRRPSPSRSW